MLLSLAFVRMNNLQAVYENLYDELPENLIPLATYFEENYITGRRARGRRNGVPARFPMKYWNCYDATMQNEHRTNNISEAWHNNFQLVVGEHRPLLCSAIREVIKEQDDIETVLEQLSLGQSVKAAPKKKWKDHQLRIRRIVASYGTYKADNDVMTYLRRLGGHLFTL